jgi:hypothetical protein
MKKFIIYWFTFLVAVYALTYCTSCSRKIIKQTTEIKETSIEKKVDSLAIFQLKQTTNELQKTLASVDSLKLQLGLIRTGNKNYDSICNAQVKQMFATLNLNRKSGNNTSGMYYDQYKNILVLYNQQGESINLTTKERDSLAFKLKQISEKNSNKSEQKVKEIPVKYVPLFIKILAVIGVLTIIFLGFKLSFFIKSKLPI